MCLYPDPNGANNDLVDEKGTLEDIYKFGSKADVVVCCLSLNKETVRLFKNIICDSSEVNVTWSFTCFSNRHI